MSGWGFHRRWRQPRYPLSLLLPIPTTLALHAAHAISIWYQRPLTRHRPPCPAFLILLRWQPSWIAFWGSSPPSTTGWTPRQVGRPDQEVPVGQGLRRLHRSLHHGWSPQPWPRSGGDGGGSGDIRVLVCMEATNMKEFQRQLYANIAKQASKL